MFKRNQCISSANAPDVGVVQFYHEEKLILYLEALIITVAEKGKIFWKAKITTKLQK